MCFIRDVFPNICALKIITRDTETKEPLKTHRFFKVPGMEVSLLPCTSDHFGICLGFSLDPPYCPNFFKI